ANVYGARDRNSHVIPRILELLQDKELPEIRLGWLGGTRDFVHVLDIVDAIIAVLMSDTDKLEIVNVGTGVPTRIQDVAEMLMSIFDDHRPVVEDRTQFRSLDRRSLTPDVRKINHLTGWRAKIGLAEGLNHFVRFARSAQRLTLVSR